MMVRHHTPTKGTPAMRKMIIGFLTAMAAVLGILTVATPAQAAGSCPTGWICFFDTGVSANYVEGRDFADANIGTCINMPSSGNNVTSYIVNRASHQWRTYANASCGGTTGLIYANSSGTMDSAHNNNISAYKRIS